MSIVSKKNYLIEPFKLRVEKRSNSNPSQSKLKRNKSKPIPLKKKIIQAPPISYKKFDFDKDQIISPLTINLNKPLSDNEKTPTRLNSLTRSDFQKIDNKFLSPFNVIKKKKATFGKYCFVLKCDEIQ